MQNTFKLFYVILGATPEGRNIEQHDVFFGIAESIQALIPEMKAFWPNTKIHMDAYQAVDFADGFEIEIVPKNNEQKEDQLFFINLGGYKIGHFEEFHEQHLMVGKSLGEVVQRVKQTEFYKTMGFDTKAVSHIDDKHGVDIDDIYNVHDLLTGNSKENFSISLVKSNKTDQMNDQFLGYYKL